MLLQTGAYEPETLSPKTPSYPPVRGRPDTYSGLRFLS